MKWTNGRLVISDSIDDVNVEQVYKLLKRTYWAPRRPFVAVERMIEHSLCFSLLDGDAQVGFGRVVTDYAVFSWVADVVIELAYRRRGLGKWMMNCIIKHPDLRGTQFVLQTLDAHTLYERYGFAKSAALMSTSVMDL